MKEDERSKCAQDPKRARAAFREDRERELLARTGLLGEPRWIVPPPPIDSDKLIEDIKKLNEKTNYILFMAMVGFSAIAAAALYSIFGSY